MLDGPRNQIAQHQIHVETQKKITQRSNKFMLKCERKDISTSICWLVFPCISNEISRCSANELDAALFAIQHELDDATLFDLVHRSRVSFSNFPFSFEGSLNLSSISSLFVSLFNLSFSCFVQIFLSDCLILGADPDLNQKLRKIADRICSGGVLTDFEAKNYSK